MKRNNFYRIICGIVLMMCLCTFGQDKKLGVVEPANSAGLNKGEVDTLWLTIENEARTAAAAGKGFTIIDRGNLKALMAEADFETNSALMDKEKKFKGIKLQGLDYLLVSSIGGFRGGKYVLNISLLNSVTGENIPGTSHSQTFNSLEAIFDELGYIVNKCINVMRVPGVCAVIYPVIINPACPQKFAGMFHEQLRVALLNNKVRIAMMDDVNKIFRDNNIDSMRSLSPRLYSKVAKQLQVKTLVMSQISACELGVRDVTFPLQKRKGKQISGVVSGNVKVVDMNGEIKALQPFETVFDFNSMIAAGEIDVRGWGVDQYYSYMIYAVVDQIVKDLSKELQ